MEPITIYDFKPAIGPIPDTPSLEPTALGKNHFKIDLLIHSGSSTSSTSSSASGSASDSTTTSNQKKRKTLHQHPGPGDEPQIMVPFYQYHDKNAPFSMDYYVATPGLAFSIRVRMERPATKGVQYGARVYIDSGEAADKDIAYESWWDQEDCDSDHNIQHDNVATAIHTNGNDGDNTIDPEDEEVDTSKADHYFWFNPGEREHWITGFYKSATQSQQFVFGEPDKSATGSIEDMSAREKLHSLGVIRIMICRVVGFKDMTEDELNQIKKTDYSPGKASVFDALDRKVQLVAEPGTVVKDGRPLTKRYAVLSNKIVHERRLVYNTFEGFNARKPIYQTSKATNISFFQGMPLNALMQSVIRKQAILTFLRQINAWRVDLSVARRNEIEDEDDKPPAAGTNEFVRVEDMVHFICRSLSPAASYIVCTGTAKGATPTSPPNYGECFVQHLGATRSQRFQDYAEKEEQLVAFFLSEPGTYQTEFAGRNSGRVPQDSYQIKLAVVEIEDDDADDDDERNDDSTEEEDMFFADGFIHPPMSYASLDFNDVDDVG